MENVRIDTTQNVRIDYELATLGDRAVAWIFDCLVYLLWIVIVAVLRDSVKTHSGDMEYVWGFLLLMPIAFYHLACELLMNGQSIGKLIMKIKVIRLDGSQPTLGNYLIRWLLRIVEFTMFFGICMVVFLMSGRGQRLGDILAHTTVIRTGRKITLDDTILSNVSEGYVPVYPQVLNLSNRDIEVIREGLAFYAKSKNHNVLMALNNRVTSVMNVEHNLPFEEFLSTVVSDYNYYQATALA